MEYNIINLGDGEMLVEFTGNGLAFGHAYIRAGKMNGVHFNGDDGGIYLHGASELKDHERGAREMRRILEKIIRETSQKG